MPDNAGRFYDIGPLRFDAAKSFLLLEGKRVRLSPKASHILGILVRSHGELVGRDEILEGVWKKKNVNVEEGAVDHYISELRRTFRKAANGDQWIETVPRRGYRFVGPVRAVGEPSGLPRQGDGAATDHAAPVEKREETSPLPGYRGRLSLEPDTGRPEDSAAAAAASTQGR